MTGKSTALFAAAALAEIGGAYLVWIGLRDDKGLLVTALGVLALGLYGVVATLQPENEFGRVLAAYGGVFIVGSIAWGMAFDSFRPDRYDLTGAAICLAGVAVSPTKATSAIQLGTSHRTLDGHPAEREPRQQANPAC